MSNISRTGSFEALGLESLDWHNPIMYTIFTTMAVSALCATLGSYLVRLYLSYSDGSIIFLVMTLIFILSIAASLIIRIPYYRLGNMVFNYEDNKIDNGRTDLKISYISRRKKERKGLHVARVELRPDIPLTKPRGEWREFVKETQSSLVIHFSNRIAVELGFPHLSTMLEALKNLNPEVKMFRCKECNEIFWKEEDVEKHQNASGRVLMRREF